MAAYRGSTSRPSTRIEPFFRDFCVFRGSQNTAQQNNCISLEPPKARKPRKLRGIGQLLSSLVRCLLHPGGPGCCPLCVQGCATTEAAYPSKLGAQPLPCPQQATHSWISCLFLVRDGGKHPNAIQATHTMSKPDPAMKLAPGDLATSRAVAGAAHQILKGAA